MMRTIFGNVLTDTTDRYLRCVGCIHESGKFFGKCIHCSRNPNALNDCYELPKMEDRIIRGKVK
jgi:predicted ATP-dependent serine protease